MHVCTRSVRILYRCVRFCIPLSADERMVLTATPACVDVRRITKGQLQVHVCMNIDERVVRALMHTVKYHGSIEAAERIGAYLGPYLATLCSNEGITHIVPIPLSKSRMRARGFNQVLLVLEYMCRTEPSIEARISSTILRRTHDTVPQTTLTRKERIDNMRNAFETTQVLDGARILLVDDVTTTGATLSAARRALLDAGADSVIALAYAGR